MKKVTNIIPPRTEIVKVTEMREALEANLEDDVMIVQDGENKKIKVENLPFTKPSDLKDPSWEDVQNKPDTFPPSEHNHDDAYSKLDHKHDFVYAEYDHNHDDKYSKVHHHHVMAEITDLPQDVTTETYVDQEIANLRSDIYNDLDQSHLATKDELKLKVDKREGWDLSQNNFDDDYKAILDELDVEGFATKSDLDTKVDKVDGMGLSEEDFTTELKVKLENLDDSGINIDGGYTNVNSLGIFGGFEVDETDKINEVLAQGGNFYFPEATYCLFKTLKVHSNTKLLFHANAVLIRKHPDSMLQTHVTANTTKYNGAQNVVIEGGHWRPDGDSDPGNVFSLFHANNVTIKDLTVTNTVASHTVDIIACNEVHILNNKFLGYIRDGKAFFRESIQIDCAHVKGYPIYDASASCYDGYSSQNILIEGNLFDKSSDHAGFLNGIGQHTQVLMNTRHSNIKIINNVLNGAYLASSDTSEYGYGIRLQQMQNVVIEGNIFRNFKTGIFSDIAEVLYDSKDNTICDRNKLPTEALADSYSIGNIDVKIENNTFYSANTSRTRPCIWYNSSDLVRDSSTPIFHKELIIKGNTFYGQKDRTVVTKYIDAETCENIVVSGNVFRGVNKSDEYGMYFAGKARKATVTGNQFIDIQVSHRVYKSGTTSDIIVLEGVSTAVGITNYQLIIDKMIKKETVKIVCYGDSITYGVVSTGEGIAPKPYPARLQEVLRDFYKNPKITVVNMGKSGRQSDELCSDTMVNEVNAQNANLVIFMCGINDKNGNSYGPVVGLTEYLANIESIMFKLNAPMMLCAPTPTFGGYGVAGVTNEQLKERHKLYVDTMNVFATNTGLKFIDTYKGINDFYETRQNNVLEGTPDAVHFTNQFYGHLADYIFAFGLANSDIIVNDNRFFPAIHSAINFSDTIKYYESETNPEYWNALLQSGTTSAQAYAYVYIDCESAELNMLMGANTLGSSSNTVVINGEMQKVSAYSPVDLWNVERNLKTVGRGLYKIEFNAVIDLQGRKNMYLSGIKIDSIEKERETRTQKFPNIHESYTKEVIWKGSAELTNKEMSAGWMYKRIMQLPSKRKAHYRFEMQMTEYTGLGIGSFEAKEVQGTTPYTAPIQILYNGGKTQNFFTISAIKLVEDGAFTDTYSKAVIVKESTTPKLLTPQHLFVDIFVNDDQIKYYIDGELVITTTGEDIATGKLDVWMWVFGSTTMRSCKMFKIEELPYETSAKSFVKGESYIDSVTLDTKIFDGNSWKTQDAISSTEGTINVKKAGISGKAGVNDTAKLQDLIRSGGDFYFPEGTYEIHSPLDLYSNTRLKLHPKATLIRMCTGHLLRTYATPNTTNLNGARNITVEGGTLQHNGNIGPSGVIGVFHSRDLTIKDTRILNTVGAHAIDLAGSDNTNLLNVIIEGLVENPETEYSEAIQIDGAQYNGYPIYPKGSICFDGTPNTNLTIKDCTIRESSDYPAFWNGIGNHGQISMQSRHKNLTIVNNNITVSGRGRYGYGIRLVGVENAQIEGNTINETAQSITCDVFVNTYTPDGVQITNTNVPLVAAMEDLYNVGCRNVIIRGNTINPRAHTLSNPGISLNASADLINVAKGDIAKHRRIIIENNIIKMINPTNVQDAISIGACEDVTVGGNILEGGKTSDRGIKVRDYAKNVTVFGNHFKTISSSNQVFVDSTSVNVTTPSTGGGTGGGGLFTKIMSEQVSCVKDTAMTLSRPISDFDELRFQIYYNGGEHRTVNFTTSTTMTIRLVNLPDSETNWDFSFFEIVFKKTDDNTITISNAKEHRMVYDSASKTYSPQVVMNNQGITIREIFGIKY